MTLPENKTTKKDPKVLKLEGILKIIQPNPVFKK